MHDNIKKIILKCPSAKQWERIGIEHHHGIDIPLFSLHSKNSCGIGEYIDLPLLIDWCVKLNLKVIQLLPLNDTGPDTSPYSALSAFALNPIHIGLVELPHLEKFHSLRETLSSLQKLKKSHRIDYPAVSKGKDRFLRKYYEHAAPLIVSTHHYQEFYQKNHEWLLPYALFKALKIAHHWYSWELWEEHLINPSQDVYEQLLSEYEDEIQYQIFLQFLCFEQMHVVRIYAEKKGIFLKGDIPILISRESADVWKHRELFNMEYSAGSPPDQYTVDGQNWGFPIYNWDYCSATKYAWWRERLKVASQFYHLYRIDHIVGFFRIWAIPLGKTAAGGKFIPSEERTWVHHGEPIMRMMLDACHLLPIGEDLGVVPPEVRNLLTSLGIGGTKVIRWERLWHNGRRYIPYQDYPPISMTTVSTHDSDTLQQWWKNSPEESSAFAKFKGWTYHPELSISQRQSILYDSHHTASLFHINLLPEYLAGVPGMTWSNHDDERINMPGIVSERNWSYRLRPSLEEMHASEPLYNFMKSVLGG